MRVLNELNTGEGPNFVQHGDITSSEVSLRSGLKQNITEVDGRQINIGGTKDLYI